MLKPQVKPALWASLSLEKPILRHAMAKRSIGDRRDLNPDHGRSTRSRIRITDLGPCPVTAPIAR